MEMYLRRAPTYSSTIMMRKSFKILWIMLLALSVLRSVLVGDARRSYWPEDHRQLFGPRIGGAKPATEGQFPSFVVIARTGDKPGFKYICSGVILNAKTILTGDGCLNSLVDQAHMLVVGATIYPVSRWSEKNVKTYRGSRICIPEFSNSHYNGFGILGLLEPIRFDARTKNAELSTKEVILGESIVATGIGDVEKGKPSDILRYVPVKFSENVDDNIVFAHGPRSQTCPRDSGGPVYRANGEVVSVLMKGDFYCRRNIEGINIYKKRQEIVKQMESCQSGVVNLDPEYDTT